MSNLVLDYYIQLSIKRILLLFYTLFRYIEVIKLLYDISKKNINYSTTYHLHYKKKS